MARSVEELYVSEWCTEFEQYMRNRLVMGALRYGLLRSGRDYDNVRSAIEHLKDYARTGNQEHLVDAANLCLVEFVRESCHPQPFFRSIDDGRHTRRIGR
jgi:hypothetical protein